MALEKTESLINSTPQGHDLISGIIQKLWSLAQDDLLHAELVKFVLEKRKRNFHICKCIIKKVMPIFPEMYLNVNVQSVLQLDI